jgi:hypothetical protein
VVVVSANQGRPVGVPVLPRPRAPARCDGMALTWVRGVDSDMLFSQAFLPLQLAVASRVPRLVLVALECIEVASLPHPTRADGPGDSSC